MANRLIQEVLSQIAEKTGRLSRMPGNQSLFENEDASPLIYLFRCSAVIAAMESVRQC